MDLHFIRNARVILDINLGKEGKEGEPQKRQDAPPLSKKGNLQRASKNRDMRVSFFVSLSKRERGEKKGQLCAKYQTRKNEKELFPRGHTGSTFFIFEPREGIYSWQRASAQKGING